jgi:hypothetical protein
MDEQQTQVSSTQFHPSPRPPTPVPGAAPVVHEFSGLARPVSDPTPQYPDAA